MKTNGPYKVAYTLTLLRNARNPNEDKVPNHRVDINPGYDRSRLDQHLSQYLVLSR